MIQITVKIEGMACGMCESHVNDAVLRAFSVKKVSSSHKRGRPPFWRGLSNVAFVQGDVGALPFEDGSFDIDLSLSTASTPSQTRRPPTGRPIGY